MCLCMCMLKVMCGRVCQSIKQSINELINPTINYSLNPSISQSINQYFISNNSANSIIIKWSTTPHTLSKYNILLMLLFWKGGEQKGNTNIWSTSEKNSYVH